MNPQGQVCIFQVWADPTKRRDGRDKKRPSISADELARQSRPPLSFAESHNVTLPHHLIAQDEPQVERLMALRRLPHARRKWGPG